MVHPIWSVYVSVSSASFFALRPSLILIRPPLFFPFRGWAGLPFGLLLPCGLLLGGLLAGLPFGLLLPCGLLLGGLLAGF